MREIEVRELKTQLDSVLSEVEDGETVRVTSGGRPVADIVPAESAEEQWERMVAEGKITPGKRPLPRNPPRRSRPIARPRS